MPDNSEKPQGEQRIKVLIVDDILEARRSVRLMLSGNPLVEVVAMASNGVQAIAKANTYQPEIVLMDIHMPGLDGLSAMYAIRQQNPSTVFIITSADRSEQTRLDSRAIGAFMFLIKPYTLDELEDAIHKAQGMLKTVKTRPRKPGNSAAEQIAALKLQAVEIIKEERVDDEAVVVFEKLAADPRCDLRWLLNLALMYVLRQEWGKLKVLAARLEQMEM